MYAVSLITFSTLSGFSTAKQISLRSFSLSIKQEVSENSSYKVDKTVKKHQSRTELNIDINFQELVRKY